MPVLDGKTRPCTKCPHWRYSRVNAVPPYRHEGTGPHVLCVIDHPVRGETLPNCQALFDILQVGCVDNYTITHAIRCVPASTAKIATAHLHACREHLDKILDTTPTAMILLCGNHAMKAVLDLSGAVGKTGQRYLYRGIDVLCAPEVEDLKDNAYAGNRIFPHLQAITSGRGTVPTHTNIVCSEDTWQRLLEQFIADGKPVAFDYETSGLSPWADKLLTIGVCNTKGVAYAVNVTPNILKMWAAFLQSNVPKIAHSAAFETIWSSVVCGVMPENLIWDTQIGSKILDENAPSGLKDQSYTLTDMPVYDIDARSYVKAGEASAAPNVVLLTYNGADADATLRLYDFQKQRLGETSSLMHQSLRYVRILAQMRERGIRIDTDKIQPLIDKLTAETTQIIDKLSQYSVVRALEKEQGMPYNLNSPAQTAKLLFHYCCLPAQRFSRKTSAPTTDTGYLQTVEHRHPIVPLLLEYRKIEQTLKTFLHPLKTLHTNGVVHPVWSVGGTNTWRLSCSVPNMQNIPKSEEVRALFKPAEGNVFVAADYSQIELRVLAALSGEETLLEAFAEGTDPHIATAAVLFKVDPSEVTDDMRAKGKRMNFGAVYGISARGLFEKFNIPEEEGRALLAAFWKGLPAVRSWIDTQHALCDSTGQVESLFGRVRHLPIGETTFKTIGRMHRQAGNFPIQSAAAEITLRAMCDLADTLPLYIQLVGQVHDSILLEAPANKVAEAKRLLKKHMEAQTRWLPVDKTGKPKVKLEVEVSAGADWYHMENEDAETEEYAN